MKSCKVVAEIGNCHLGQINRAEELIKLAHICGAYAVKFQKRNPVECVPEELQNEPHPNPEFSYGDTYLEHRENLELSIEQHKRLKYLCDQLGIVYSTSVWDMTSAQEVVQELNPEFIKIGSPSNSNFDMLKYLFQEYEGEIHISTGMTTEQEIDAILMCIKNNRRVSDVVIYHCTSEYPCPFERLCLKEINKLRDRAQKILGKSPTIGFSNHGYGIACDVVAVYAMGVQWIERHFVDDRTLRHNDASASLEPDGLRRLCRDIKAVDKAMSFKKEMSKKEIEQRKKLKGH